MATTAKLFSSKDADRGYATGNDAANDGAISDQVVNCEDVNDSKVANKGDVTGNDAANDNAASSQVVNCEDVNNDATSEGTHRGDDSKDAISVPRAMKPSLVETPQEADNASIDQHAPPS